MHSDTAGSKPALAYLYWKETGSLQGFKNVAIDAMVMNLDDLMCVGAVDKFLINSTIGRNKFLIPGEVLGALIDAQAEFIEKMSEYRIEIQHTGGETADVGNIVRTLDIGATAFARMKREDVISCSIKAGMFIVGLSSYGEAHYEDAYNSGISANGLTSGVHDIFGGSYAENYPEVFAPEIPLEYIFQGDYQLEQNTVGDITAGDLMLSPTRTYLPIMKQVYDQIGRDNIGAVIHNTGGGLTKVKNFLPKGVDVLKDNLFKMPYVFEMLSEKTKLDNMLKTYNCGQRLEVYISNIDDATRVINIAGQHGVEAKVIGETFASKEEGGRVIIKTEGGRFEY